LRQCKWAQKGKSWNYWRLVTEWYRAARRLGLDLDIVSERDNLTGYDLVLVPSLPIISHHIMRQVKDSGAHFIFGPRSGSKTEDFQVPETLAPGKLQSVLRLKVTHSESLREGVDTPGGGKWWLDHVETNLTPDHETGTVYSQGNVALLTTVMAETDLSKLIAKTLKIKPHTLPEDLRIRRRGDLVFAFNYGNENIALAQSLTQGAKLLLGGQNLPPAGVACWRDI